VIFSCVATADEGTGWSSAPIIEAPSWKEEALRLPAYPDKDRLVEVPARPPGDDFRVFIDPDSLSVGNDRVVRYTLVITSSSGVGNISYEGLHCGAREYRRYAYGSNGAWHPIEASPWQRIADSGRSDYHHVLYWNYLCDPVQTNLDVEEMLRRLRHPSESGLHD
jgi:CNP1-like family protein